MDNYEKNNNIMKYNINNIEDHIIIINIYEKPKIEDIEYFIKNIDNIAYKNNIIKLYNDNIIRKELFIKKFFLLNDNKKISIIIINKKKLDLLFLTLLTLNKSKYNNFEVIIIDMCYDCESKPLFIKNINFNYPIKLFYIENDITNKSIYDISIKNSVGDIIIIYNLDFFYFGDIPYYVSLNFKYDDYFIFPCYFLDNNLSYEIIFNNFNIENIKIKDEYIDYKLFNLCIVISRNYYKILNLNNNIFLKNLENNYFLDKIKNVLKLNIVYIDKNNDISILILLENINYIENIINNNEISCPKLFHYYWDNFENFTFMNLYSLKSSLYYHNDYIHIIWCPINPNNNITWEENFHKDFEKDEYCNEYFEEINTMDNVIIINIEMDKFLNVNNDMSEIHKSDIFRYNILYIFGGIWSDLDIVYIKRINTIINFNFDNIFFKCNYFDKKIIVYPIGILLSKRKTLFYENLLKNIVNIYYDKYRYQCLGSEMFNKIFNNKQYTTNDGVIFLNEEIYMNYNWMEIENLFIDYKNNIKNLKNTIGFHWFNGSKETRNYLKNIKKNKIPYNYNGILFLDKYKFIIL